MSHDIDPMKAKLASRAFDDPNWLFEIKWDGYRAIAEINGKHVNLYSRNLLSFNEMFSEIAETLKNFRRQAVLDGEVAAVDQNGRPQFQLLQNFRSGESANLIYFVFDLLYLDGYDLRAVPLKRRKEILKEILPDLPNVRYSEHVSERGKDFFELINSEGLEGIIAKDCSSPYRTGRRSAEWLKIKTHMRQEAVIGGWTDPRGSRKDLGALVLGVYENGELKYIGHTGGGFNQVNLYKMKQRLKQLEQSGSPFKEKFKTNAPVHWVKPELVCEVAFRGWTDTGHMRQPIFVGMREDKPAREVRRETAQPTQKLLEEESASKQMPKTQSVKPQKFEPTHRDKIFWPKEKYTKGDVVDYYEKVARYILPYLKDRPESMNRHPNGIAGKSFFQKDVDHQPPKWVKVEPIYSEGEERTLRYLVCQDAETLKYMANLGCIEINPWNSRLKHLDNPDFLVIDLDPEEISFAKVIEAANEVHDLFEEICVDSYCKTSGATGLHIYVPLGAKYDYDQARDFAHIVAIMVNKRLPKITSVERSPKKRKKKIYLDYLQNRRGQTLAAPYSLRPRPGAPVSTPLMWKEVKKGLDPKDFNIKTIFRRLEKVGDLWKPVLSKGVDLQKALKKIK